MRLLKSLSLLILMLYFSGCDFDRYTGYDYSAQDLLKAAPVSGRITHFYTGEVVTNALVRVGSQETLTDNTGSFNISYLLNTDTDRNRPVDFRVSAPNFYNISFTFLLEPTGNSFDLQLKYAAPVIKRTMRRTYRKNKDFESICQAEIVDYQGIETIESVSVVYFYTERPDSVVVQLQRVQILSENSAYFQARKITSDLKPFNYVIVRDQEQYTHRVLYSLNLPFQDDYLFEPY